MEPEVVTRQPELARTAGKTGLPKWWPMRERTVPRFEPPITPTGTLRISAPYATEKNEGMWLRRVAECLTSVAYSMFPQQEVDEDSDEEFIVTEDQVVKEELIGAGAQGRVYKGKLYRRNGKSLKTVAVKCVSSIDDSTLRHLRSIKHDNLVHTIGACVDATVPFLVIELCRNGSLYDYLHSEASISPVQVISWLTGIARGMLYLHNKKIIHRDLKSPNVLMVNDFDLKVSDFGTCRKFDVTSDVTTFAGTISWMAPEVIRHERYTQKADVWSFGVVVWEVLTRQVPYHKLEQYSILWGVGNHYISLPVPNNIPEKLSDLITKCQTRAQRERPDFHKVLSLVNEAESEVTRMDPASFQKMQKDWARDTQQSTAIEEEVQQAVESGPRPDRASRLEFKRQRLAAAERLRAANDLLMEAASVRLQLERRETDLAASEKVALGLKAVCKCCKRTLKMKRQSSTSSETKEDKPKMIVQFKDGKVVSSVAKNCSCVEGIRKDNVESKKDTVVTIGGKVQTASYGSQMSNKRKLPDVAHV